MINIGELIDDIEKRKEKLKSLLGIYYKQRCFNRNSLIDVMELEFNPITGIKNGKDGYL